VFAFFGFGRGHTIIEFTDIVVGSPDPSNFLPPAGACIKVYSPPSTSPKTLEFPNALQYLGNIFKQNPIFSALSKINPLPSFSEKLQKFSENVQKFPSEFMSKKRERQGPIPPRLNQAFTAHWFLNASKDLTPPYTPYTLSGNLAFDLTTSGLVWSIESSTGNIPLDIQFEFRLYPSRTGLELLQVGPDGSCYSYIFVQWIFTFLIPQWEIPYNAGEQGTAIVNGDNCTVWQTTYNWYEHFSELYVRNSDHTLVQVTLPEPFGHGLATITLSDIKPGVNPSAYSRPSDCVETMTWNSAWESHLPWDWCDPFC